MFAALAFAQQNPTPALSTHSDSESAPAAVSGEGRIKLDVVVADKSGKPVSGLGLDDFTLLDNNQPSKILSFSAVDGAVQKADPPVEVILLIDEVNVGPQGMALFQNEVEKFLRQNGGQLAQPILLFALTDKGLDALAPSSLDGNLLAAKVGSLDNRFRTINSSAGEWGMSQRLRLSLLSLRAIAQSEARKPGRKLLIWIGPGWPTWDVRAFPPSTQVQQDSFDWIVQLSSRLREARISVYTPGTSLSYERFLNAVRTAGEANIADLALGVLAVQSGGSVLNSVKDKDLAAQIEHCVRDGSAFYTLSFDPPRVDHPDEYHDLKIQIDKPKLAARTNTGYYNQPETKSNAANNHASSDNDASQVAARPVTVAQLEQALKDVHGQSDADVARLLSSLVLTERLNSAKLSVWKADLSGTKAQQALVALADASAFLAPPAAEIPADAPPDLAAQRNIMAQSIDYLGKTIPKLPDFFATRQTTHYEETPPKRGKAGTATSSGGPSHFAAASSATVLYRDGHEVVDAGIAKGKKPDTEADLLITKGTFGPILSVVIGDAADGGLKWSRWEQGANGPQAVFRFAVPQEKSHYVRDFDTASFKNEGDNLQHSTSYHGEMAVDPATGTILRLVVEADHESGSPLARADIMVEYGPVEIGGKNYFCPVRSVSISRGPSFLHFDSGGKPVFGPVMTMLNDVAFVDYHVFRSEVKVLSANDLAPEAK
jgi:VWFA-related protein